jgi:Protein of unknown function (DUF2281)
MTDQIILSQLKQMPDDLKQEVINFIGYLLAKNNLTILPTKQRPKHFGQYRGSLKTGLSVQEIDAQLNQLRNEWERPIS